MSESRRGKKRTRLDEEAGGKGAEEEGGSREEDGEDKDVKLCQGLSALVGNRKYVKESALSRDVLLAYVKERGDVVRVKLVRVSVQEMGGRSFGVTLDEKENKVKDLKCAVEEQEGFAVWSQQLFRFGGGDCGGDGSAAPLLGSVAVSDEERFALCVDSQSTCLRICHNLAHFLCLTLLQSPRRRRMGRLFAFAFRRHEAV